MKTSMGLCGATGKTPNIEVGYVKQVNYNDKAKVILTGTRENPILNFEIPKGKDGAKLVVKEYFNGDITVLNNLRDLPQEVSDEHNKTVMSVNGIKELLDKVNEINRDYKLKDNELSRKIESEKETLKNLITSLERTLISKINNINDVKLTKIENDIIQNSTDISLNTQDINTLKSENEKLKEVNKKLNDALDSTLIYVDREGEEITEYTTIAPVKNLKIKGKTVVTDAPTETNENNKRIESSGELEGNKIKLYAHGKNFYNGVFFNDKYVDIINGGVLGLGANCVASDFIEVSPQTNYVINNLVAEDIGFYDENKTFIRGVRSNNLTTPQNTKFIRCTIKPKELKFQLEEGTQATTYEPYKEDKKEILFGLDGGLKSLPNGVSDTIEQRDDGFYLIQKVKKVIFDGTQTWREQNDREITHVYTLDTSELTSCVSSTGENSFSNLFPAIGSGDVEKFLFYDTGTLYVAINKDKLENTSASSFMKYLSNNNLEIYCQLKTPIETKLDIDNLKLETYKDLTYITSENNIKPTLNVSVSKSVNSIIEEIKRKVYALDTPNIKEV